jgi:hypothetical protein
MTKTTFIVVLVLLAVAASPGLARADAATCSATASDKKLAGAAKTSFMKKCESEAKATCDAASAEKKLAGAAKASFTQKCLKDAVGS